MRAISRKEKYLNAPSSHVKVFSPPGTPWTPAFTVFDGQSKRLPVWPGVRPCA